MNMPSVYRALLLVAVLGLLVSCRGAGDRSEPPAIVAARVNELLYQRNLISDPEVGAKMNEYVLQVSRDGTPADLVMPAFHRWLVRWIREHPARVDSAWAAPAPYRRSGPPLTE
ncbi:MAG TPA: hypothetical protein VFR37_22940 [Longimicrobium sp.]|nr:hypothetical protein [Longimicrobium sp.]